MSRARVSRTRSGREQAYFIEHGKLRDGLAHLGDEAFEIRCFGHGGMHRMIRPLAARVDQPGVQPTPGRGLGHAAAQGLGGKMVRAGRACQHAARRQQAHGQTVDLAVGRQALGRVFAAFDEGGRVQAD